MLRFIIFVTTILIAPGSEAGNFDHSEWNQLLQEFVTSIRQGQASVVDYSGMQANRLRLTSYTESLSAVSQSQFDQWPQVEQLAFLINAYNAWTVELVLEGYPDIDSIKDLGGFLRSPWSKSFIPLLGSLRSLDDIEHKMIRGSDRNDPRIHFAVNCASIGCPALRPEAYAGDRLESQLQDQQELFLSDRTRNRLEQGTLLVSSIFKWYGKDFENAGSGIESLRHFLARHGAALGLSGEDISQLEAGKIAIDYLEYDWRLNDQRSVNESHK
jgi:hypothetical protein